MKIRTDTNANYRGIFFNGKTVRQKLNHSLPITAPRYAEIEDVAINSKCLAICFVAGSPVRTNNGLKHIEQIQVNDIVTSFNENTRVFEDKKVYELFKNEYKGIIVKIEVENNIYILCTPNHKFFTDKGWLSADALTAQMDLLVGIGKNKEITNINYNDFNGYVYNFSVEDNHNYMVEDVIVSNCHYCYTSATKNGTNFENIVDKALNVWGVREENDRPFQIAIGGAGESTIHPQWVDFVKTVNSLGIVPNYTTNAMHLSDEVLVATEKYCGGVAISYHPHIKNIFHEGIKKMSTIKTRLNTHIIIGDAQSLIDAKEIYELYKDQIEYFVMLPYQAAGRGKVIETEAVWKELFVWINSLPVARKNQFAFGALFYPYLMENKVDLEINIYEPEIYSGYRMFDDSYQDLRKSSYDLTIKNVI